MSGRPRSWDVERPTAPPDHSDLRGPSMPIARPLAVGDRAAWLREVTVRRGRGVGNGRGQRKAIRRTVETLGTVTAVDIPGQPPGVQLELDEPVNGATSCYGTHREIMPRPGR